MVVGLTLAYRTAGSGYVYAVGAYVSRNVEVEATVLHPGRGPQIINVTWISSGMTYDFTAVQKVPTTLTLQNNDLTEVFFFKSSHPVLVEVVVSFVLSLNSKLTIKF